jgi:hypothetical protein
MQVSDGTLGPGSQARTESKRSVSSGDWAAVQRLFHREGLTRKAIARRLGMNRTTVIRLLALREPPRYERRRRPASQLDPYRAEIRSTLGPTRPSPRRSSASTSSDRGTGAGSRSSRSTSRADAVEYRKDGRHHGPPGVHGGPRLPANVVPARRDRPVRLVAYRHRLDGVAR